MPRGCRSAKLSGLKPFSTSTDIASASPSASAAVVLAVGTRFIGQASSDTLQSSATVGGAAERRRGVAGQGDERGAEALQRLEQAGEFLGLAAVRQRDHDVARLNHAEVAVHGLGRVHEVGGRAGARERRRDLPADDARLAHAGEDHAAAAVAHQRDGGREALVEAIGERPARRPPRSAAPCGPGPGQPSDLTIRSTATSWRSSGSSRPSGRALAASLLARGGSSWTSMKTPSTPAATPARASGAMYCGEADGHAVAGAGQLQAVRDVEHDRVARARASSAGRACRRRGCCSRTTSRAR